MMANILSVVLALSNGLLVCVVLRFVTDLSAGELMGAAAFGLAVANLADRFKRRIWGATQ